MDTATWVQILDKFVCILDSVNTFGNGIDPLTLPYAMGK